MLLFLAESSKMRSDRRESGAQSGTLPDHASGRSCPDPALLGPTEIKGMQIHALIQIGLALYPTLPPAQVRHLTIDHRTPNQARD
jgi:hypothetical protein